jgi:hypothetical protein
MSDKGESGKNTATNFATTGSIVIIIIVVMVTVNTALNYSGVSANASSSAIASSGTQVSSSALNAPIVDGQSESIPGYCQPSLTTSKANDVLILFIGAEGSGPLVSLMDTAGLTWHHRASAPFNFTTDFETVEEWYATSASPLSNDNITIKTTTAGDFHCFVLAVAGANPASPFDPSAGCGSNAAVPQSAESSNGTANGTVTICTSNRNDLLVSALWATGSYSINSVPTGFIALAGGGMNSFNEAYEQVSAAQTSLPVTWTFYGNDSWGVIGDAIAPGGL